MLFWLQMPDGYFGDSNTRTNGGLEENTGDTGQRSR